MQKRKGNAAAVDSVLNWTWGAYFALGNAFIALAVVFAGVIALVGSLAVVGWVLPRAEGPGWDLVLILFQVSSLALGTALILGGGFLFIRPALKPPVFPEEEDADAGT